MAALLTSHSSVDDVTMIAVERHHRALPTTPQSTPQPVRPATTRHRQLNRPFPSYLQHFCITTPAKAAELFDQPRKHESTFLLALNVSPLLSSEFM